MIPKPVMVTVQEYKEDYLKLRDKQHETIMCVCVYVCVCIYTYIHIERERQRETERETERERLLYQNLIVTINQTSIIDIHTKKKKEYIFNGKGAYRK